MKRDVRKTLEAVNGELDASYRAEGLVNNTERLNLPTSGEIVAIVRKILALLFPGFSEKSNYAGRHSALWSACVINEIYIELKEAVCKSIRFGNPSLCKDDCQGPSESLTLKLIEAFPAIRKKLVKDAQAAYDGDPACQSLEEIILCYPGFHAVCHHRIAHELYLAEIPLLPRMIGEHSHSVTGCDIHPGANVGESFFIDHATGVVIGETTEIGDRVKLYQHVTLGALSFNKDENGSLVRNQKRHPTIGDDVVIYSGSTILGGETFIGEGSVIGGNLWITKSVPPETVVVFVHQLPSPSRLSQNNVAHS